MIRIALALTVSVAIGVVLAVWMLASRAEGPVVNILRPMAFVGMTTTFEATVETPRADLIMLMAAVEQNGEVYPLFSLDQASDAVVQQQSDTQLRVRRTFDHEILPNIQPGPARVIVRATRPVLFGLREATTDTFVEVVVRLDPPKLTPLSTLHYVNHGGSEFIVYQVTPTDAESGVRVGTQEYPGYPATGVGIDNGDDLRVAFFALLHDQDLTTPIELYATDPAGNTSSARFDFRVFEQDFRRSRIRLNDSFLRRVVLAIASQTPELADENINSSTASSELLNLYLFINGELRRRNRAVVAEYSTDTSINWLWEGPFRQLPNSQVESAFADHRTYMYGGNEVDQQVHLGFDLASTANTPIYAANAGRVLFASYLGIYGNCVIIDHGMGLQSLYAHLSSIDVTTGTLIDRGKQIGVSGQTGLAGGDHLHFTMLLNGHPVTPMEWWDPNWLEDRVLRKLREAQ